MPDNPQVSAFPLGIVMRASQADLLDLAKGRALDPSVFDEAAPYFFSARVSTSRLDAYYTHALPSTLRQFAADAEAGIAFQDSHKTDSLHRTLGQSLTGTYTGPGGDGVAHMDADFYALRGDPTVDLFIRNMRGGIARDVSAGFYGGRWMCDICGRDMLSSWDCYHIPGFEYVAVDDAGNKTDKKVTATAGIDGAHLAEASTVYDGATPGATITKAQREADAGRLRPEQARLLEARYRIHLPGTGIVVPGASIREPHMPQPEFSPDELRALFEPFGIGPDTLDDGMRQVAETVARKDREIARLTPLAADGTAYRTRQLDRAVAEYVRFCAATGIAITEDTVPAKRSMLERLAIPDVDAMGDGWAQVADAKLGTGRQTIDVSERDTAGIGLVDVPTPDAAYAA